MSDPAFFEDLFAPFARISTRRMFGGIGLYRDGLMFGLVADDVVYLKSDSEADPTFVAAGAEPFVYEAGGGKRAVMSYRRLPDEGYEDPDALVRWARVAWAAALRASAKKSRKPVGERTKKPR
ncbi:MAG: TfoX/Sxy family protein [Alphaproteobacteria bacterium]